MELKPILEDLLATKVVKVTGSFADGTQTDESDIDFKVKEDHPEARIGTNIQKVMEVCERNGIKCRSTESGYIFTHRTSGNGHLSRQMEFSDRFIPRPNRLKEVEIEGVVFKTH